MKLVSVLCILSVFSCKAAFINGSTVRLEMSAPQQAVLLFANTDGDVKYGGGLDAIHDKTTWRGAMNEDQLQAFDALLIEIQNETLNSQSNKGQGSYTLRFREGTKDATYTVSLTNKTVKKLYDLLMKVADKRFKRTLDALPKPSIDAMLQNRGLGEKQ